MRYLQYLFILFLLTLWSCHLKADSEEDSIIRRIQAHATIKDFAAAVEEAQNALQRYPRSVSVHEGLIRALAKSGEERKLLQAWDAYIQKFPAKAMNRELIEEMAWGILRKASHSSSLIMREMALLAAFFSQESQGVIILYQGMNDSNYAIRALAVKLAGHFRDYKLVKEVTRLFKEEKVWAVRQQVLEAIGSMKIVSLRDDLETLIASNESLVGEKALAIAALLELLDTINRTEIETLSSSNRAGLRQLACQAIAYFQSIRDLDQLLRLTEDPQPNVRLEAFQAIGQLRPAKQDEKIVALARKGAKDRNYQVALSAAWLLALYKPDEGEQFFLKMLKDKRKAVRSLAAAALAATGQYGMTLSLEEFRSHSDPYVRLNLALGLIGQRQAAEEAAEYIREMLAFDKEKWEAVEVGLFRTIMNKTSKRVGDSLTTLEDDNQLLRLEMLNLLAILKVRETQQAIREYLIERSSEISATAAALLLTEGDESAIALVQQLLQDRQPRVRLQAALILSLWSRDETAIQTLEEGYSNSDWDLKTKILEGLGRIGSTRSIPFLIQVLKEPSQTLRLIAAMALIQCLNH